ncbi:hypothetical protein [Burkholderia sp. WAC0059]|uniref:hypothetical protein n=1 Tax=Burkholderia sp. WAC0059 TaxID=2066022 RepID=UPI0015E08879|nr:hypothetical protein [Burkholderia sp. WAC0059]
MSITSSREKTSSSVLTSFVLVRDRKLSVPYCVPTPSVAYLPGLAMRHIADQHAGEAKTDVLKLPKGKLKFVDIELEE